MKNSLKSCRMIAVENHWSPRFRYGWRLFLLSGGLLMLAGCGGGRFLTLRTPLGAGIAAGERYLLNIRADEAAKRLNQEHQSARSLSDLPMLEAFFRNAANPVAGKDLLAQQTLSRAMLYHQVLNAANEKNALQIIRKREKLKLGYDIAKTYFDCLILREYLAAVLPGTDAGLTRSVRTRLSQSLLEYSALTGVDFIAPENPEALVELEVELRSPIPSQVLRLRLAGQNRFGVDAELPPELAVLRGDSPPHLRTLKLARILYETPGLLQKDYYRDPVLRTGIQNTLLLIAAQTQMELAETALLRAQNTIQLPPPGYYESLIDLTRAYFNLKSLSGLPPETPYPQTLPSQTTSLDSDAILPILQKITE